METNRIDDIGAAVAALSALAQPHRLAVFRELVKAGENGLAAGELARRLELPASSLSFHLSNLKQAALLQEERRGRTIIYRVDFATMRGVIAFLLESCCAEEGVQMAGIDELIRGEPS